MIVDFEEKFCCGICAEKFNEKDKQPKILKCGHTICVKCLNKINKQSDFKCPYCKLSIDKSYIAVAPTNFAILSLLDSTNDNDVNKNCTIHKQSLILNCKTCSLDICQMCIIQNHNGHIIGQSFSKALDPINKQIEEMKKELKSKNMKNKISKNIEETKFYYEILKSNLENVYNTILGMNYLEMKRIEEIEEKIIQNEMKSKQVQENKIPFEEAFKSNEVIYTNDDKKYFSKFDEKSNLNFSHFIDVNILDPSNKRLDEIIKNYDGEQLRTMMSTLNEESVKKKNVTELRNAFKNSRSNPNKSIDFSEEEKTVYSAFENYISEYSDLCKDSTTKNTFFIEVSNMFNKLKNHELNTEVLALLIKFTEGMI
jgi:hypothetical protein